VRRSLGTAAVFLCSLTTDVTGEAGEVCWGVRLVLVCGEGRRTGTHRLAGGVVGLFFGRSGSTEAPGKAEIEVGDALAGADTAAQAHAATLLLAAAHTLSEIVHTVERDWLRPKGPVSTEVPFDGLGALHPGLVVAGRVGPDSHGDVALSNLVGRHC
jgi:hypothetical protein